MGYIKRLPEDLIKKIAAGEVIERPASVVKELVENSIDASSTKIEIEVERGGKYIKVSDNGMGIDPDDIPLLFTRHATSKIKNFEDLWTINSLGFRGEALASISAVSRIICKSKHINNEYGFEIKVSEGVIKKKSSAVVIGTIFEIDDLFYNVPARQKFLKSEATEVGHIYDVVQSLALSHSKISFSLSNNKNNILKTSASGNLKQTVIELLGIDLKDKLISIHAKNHFLNLEGYISALEIFRQDRKSLFLFVNNRPIKCQIISKAVTSAYEGLLPAGKFPIIVLNFNFKPKFIDINVHPTKKEVRYTHPNDVYNLVLHSIQDRISNHYKKEYTEKSIYSLPEDSGKKIIPSSSYSEAAFDLYSPSLPKTEESVKPVVETIHELSLLFSVNNLKCQITYSDKPIANMTKIGNKTIFEVGMIFEDNLQIVFSGEINGSQEYQKKFFNSLSDLSNEIYKTYSTLTPQIQKKLINSGFEEEENKEKTRKKPPDEILYKVWERDNWTCVYCSKQLLDPEIVKKAMPNAKDAFILRKHIASYDHFLPASKLPQFNFDLENLFACCIECNKKKSDSMELKSWEPKRQNNWGYPLEIAGLCFENPRSYRELKPIT